jgi:hypothetical protein
LLNDGASALRCLRALAALCAADQAPIARVPAELWDAERSPATRLMSEFFSGENERRLARQLAHEKMLEALGASHECRRSPPLSPFRAPNASDSALRR